MTAYHKIQTVFKRDPETKFRTLLQEYSLPEFEYLKDNQWLFTEKVDGTNIRVQIVDKEIVIGGRTDRSQIQANLYTALNNIFSPVIDAPTELTEGFVFYGEGYGNGIQKVGKNYRDDVSLILFDIKVGDWWLQRHDMEDVASQLGLPTVPLIGYGPLSDMVDLVKGGFNSAWGDFPAEGLVGRPRQELRTRSGDRIITKLKTRDYRPYPHTNEAG